MCSCCILQPFWTERNLPYASEFYVWLRIATQVPMCIPIPSGFTLSHFPVMKLRFSNIWVHRLTPQYCFIHSRVTHWSLFCGKHWDRRGLETGRDCDCALKEIVDYTNQEKNIKSPQYYRLNLKHIQCNYRYRRQSNQEGTKQQDESPPAMKDECGH